MRAWRGALCCTRRHGRDAGKRAGSRLGQATPARAVHRRSWAWNPFIIKELDRRPAQVIQLRIGLGFRRTDHCEREVLGDFAFAIDSYLNPSLSKAARPTERTIAKIVRVEAHHQRNERLNTTPSTTVIRTPTQQINKMNQRIVVVQPHNDRTKAALLANMCPF